MNRIARTLSFILIAASSAAASIAQSIAPPTTGLLVQYRY